MATEIVDFPEDPDAPIKAKDHLLSPRAIAFLQSMDAQSAAGLIRVPYRRRPRC